MTEYTQEQIQEIMNDMARPDGVAEFESEYAAEGTKYTGPLAIVSYEGPQIKNTETGNMMMHTNDNETIGKCLYAGGARYEGGFYEDMLHGFGVFIDPMGNKYEGEFVHDKREGKAKFTHNYGVYEGVYFDNKRNGMGKEVDNDGNTFEGRFENGDAIQGTMTYNNGDVYQGLFLDDEPHGKGKLTTAKGRVQDGIWKEGEFVGPIEPVEIPA
jgi:hypothetical protein